jgi:hypothetical protein
MSEPTNDGKQHPEPDPERDQDEVQDDQTPDSTFGDPTAPIWAEPTAPVAPAQTPPGAADPHADLPSAHPQATPPAAPPLSNPYAQGPPPASYAQGPPPASYAQQSPPAPYGQAEPGQFPTYGQPYASGQHTEANTSAIVLTVLSGVSLIFCNVLAIASLILGIVALTKNTSDQSGSRRLTRIGWIVFASVWAVAILVLVGLIILGATSSDNSTTHMFGN